MAVPLRHVRPKPCRVFEDLPGFFQQRIRHQHVSGSGGQEVRNIEAGCALDQRRDARVLQHAVHEQRRSFVRGHGYFHPPLFHARILPQATHPRA
jgi:hypothetical protein